jgi:hypothetical protein
LKYLVATKMNFTKALHERSANKQERQGTNHVTPRRVRITIVTVEEQCITYMTLPVA